MANFNIKYALADKVKTSFGYIMGCIYSKYLSKLLFLCYEETKDLLEKRRQIKEKELKENEQVKIKLELEKDDQYLQNLEEKLDKIHLQLVKVCVVRRALEKN